MVYSQKQQVILSVATNSFYAIFGFGFLLCIALSLYLTYTFWAQLGLMFGLMGIVFEIAKYLFVGPLKPVFQESLIAKVRCFVLAWFLVSLSAFTNYKQIDSLTSSIVENSVKSSESYQSLQNQRRFIEEDLITIQKAIDANLANGYRKAAMELLETKKQRLQDLAELDNQISKIKTSSISLNISDKIRKPLFLGVAIVIDLILIKFNTALLFLIRGLKNNNSLPNNNVEIRPTPEKITKVKEKETEENLIKKIKKFITTTGNTNLRDIRTHTRANMLEVSSSMKDLLDEGFLVKNGRTYSVAV
jgi:hypothetical protein